MRQALFVGLLNEGVLLQSGTAGAMNSLTTGVEIDTLVDSTRRVVQRSDRQDTLAGNVGWGRGRSAYQIHGIGPGAIAYHLDLASDHLPGLGSARHGASETFETFA